LRSEEEDDKQRSFDRKSTNELKQDTKLVNLIRNAIEASSDENGWAHLGQVGSHIAKQSPDFDPRNYGYQKLGELVSAIKLFKVEERSTGNVHSSDIISKTAGGKICHPVSIYFDFISSTSNIDICRS